MSLHKQKWLFAVALSIPMLVFFAGYLFNHDASLIPTGFIQYDNVSYVAYAKQYTEPGGLHLFYSNPFNDSAGYAPVYFQPQTLLFALLLKLGVPAGWILVSFTLLCSAICFRLLIAIVDHLLPHSKYKTIITWLLAWGGGLLTLTGWIAQQLPGHETISSIFYFDPGVGWWGLNLGRSLFFSCEAYYHALFLGVILCLLKQKWAATIVLTALLSLSHPFTGIELLCIVTAWVFVEKLFFKSSTVPVWLMAGLIILLAFHLFYYLYYLNLAEDHHSVSSQYALDWKLRYYNMLPAYCIAGSLAISSLFVHNIKGKWLQRSESRLFLTWFIVAFTLANHELFIKPQQPVHFTRGYIWTALFLLGLPALDYLLDRLNQSSYKKVIAGSFILLFASDNIAWISLSAGSKATVASVTYINKEQQTVFDHLTQTTDNSTLLVSRDENISYLSSVYTEVYPWYSHPFTTPFAARKNAALTAFFEQGVIDSSWKQRNLVFVFRKSDSLDVKRAETFASFKSLETASYIVANVSGQDYRQ